MKTKKQSDSGELIAKLYCLMRSSELTECERNGLAKALALAKADETNQPKLIKENAQFLLRRAAKLMSPEQFNLTVKAAPWAALEYAAEFLSPKQLQQTTEAAPWAALVFAAKFLSPELLEIAAQKHPITALECAHKFLSPKLRSQCSKALNFMGGIR